MVRVFTSRDVAVHAISLRRANQRERNRYAAQAQPQAQPNPELIDQTAPEATDAWFARARPAREVLPGLLGDPLEQCASGVVEFACVVIGTLTFKFSGCRKHFTGTLG